MALFACIDPNLAHIFVDILYHLAIHDVTKGELDMLYKQTGSMTHTRRLNPMTYYKSKKMNEQHEI